jgi:hypothetical protein
MRNNENFKNSKYGFALWNALKKLDQNKIMPIDMWQAWK